jgi:hypothetical protein
VEPEGEVDQGEPSRFPLVGERRTARAPEGELHASLGERLDLPEQVELRDPNR